MKAAQTLIAEANILGEQANKGEQCSQVFGANEHEHPLIGCSYVRHLVRFAEKKKEPDQKQEDCPMKPGNRRAQYFVGYGETTARIRALQRKDPLELTFDERQQLAATPFRDGTDYINHYLLQTWVERLEYDWQKRIGKVWCRGPVDMTGTISLFTTIDEGVNLILSYLDGQPDTVYRKRGEEWEAGGPGR